MKKNHFKIGIFILLGCLLISFKPQDDFFRSLPFEFEFDQIDYYRINISDEDYYALNKVEEQKDDYHVKKKLEVILSIDFKNIKRDTLIVNEFEKLGFTKIKIKQNLNDSIYSSFHDHPNPDRIINLCTPIYRDILVFRNSGVIVSMAYLCFGCQHNYLNLLIENPPNFYDSVIDYNVLRKLLHSQAMIE